MSGPDWYTGSDETGEVADGIEATIDHMNDQEADHTDIEELERLLELEQEPNWRCFLLGLIGTIHYDLDENEPASRILHESVSGYRTYLDSFDSVINVYCQACYTLGVLLYDEQRYEEAMPCFIRCIPFVHEVFEEVYSANVFLFLESCCSQTGQPELALVYAEVGAFFRGCDCSSMEKLMIAYDRAGRLDKATEIFHLLSKQCREFEHFDRVMEYAQLHLGETGTIN
jgi:tetratricopeptide (TPR) repeat protein